MSEIYLITRGFKHDVDQWITHMLSQYYPQTIYQDDFPIKRWVQGNLKPIQLWSYGFPDNALQDVLHNIPFKDSSHGEKVDHVNKGMWLLRKALGAEKIPDKLPNFNPPKRMLYNKNVQVMGIGYRKDPIAEAGQFKGSEML